jgi:hypothetical protein
MKAIVYHSYGPPDVVKCEEIEKPVPNDDEVLIRVHAASVNPADRHLMRGVPYIARILFGLSKPSIPLTRNGSDPARHARTLGIWTIYRRKQGAMKSSRQAMPNDPGLIGVA